MVTMGSNSTSDTKVGLSRLELTQPRTPQAIVEPRLNEAIVNRRTFRPYNLHKTTKLNTGTL